MVIERVSRLFTKEKSSFSERDAIDLAKRLRRRGYSSWEKVLSLDEQTLKFNSIGSKTLEKLDRFKEMLAEKAKTSVGIREHTVRYKACGKSVKYGLYLVDGFPVSFPSPYSDQTIIWLLKGDSRRISIQLSEGRQEERMTEDIRSDVQFLNDHFDLGLEFRKVESDGIKYFSVQVPPKTKIL